jgi:hypothetical protein
MRRPFYELLGFISLQALKREMELVRRDYPDWAKLASKQLKLTNQIPMQHCAGNTYLMQLVLRIKQMRVHLGGSQDCPFTPTGSKMPAGSSSKAPAFRWGGRLAQQLNNPKNPTS